MALNYNWWAKFAHQSYYILLITAIYAFRLLADCCDTWELLALEVLEHCATTC